MHLLYKFFLVISAVIFVSASSIDASKEILGVWETKGEEPSRIEIFQKGDKFYGKIIWLANPLTDGAPKKDIHNPDKKLQQRPIMGLELLKNFKFNASDNIWEDGTIYDPMSGNTYKCYIRRQGNTLKVRGYIGISLIGRTEIWTKV